MLIHIGKNINIKFKNQPIFKSNIFKSKKNIIEKLKIQKDLAKNELTSPEIKKPDSTDIKIKRAYKEPFVEKWLLNINSMKNSGMIVVRYGDETEMDILLNNKFIVSIASNEFYLFLGIRFVEGAVWHLRISY